MQLLNLEGVFWSDYGIYQPGDMIAKFIEASANDMVNRVYGWLLSMVHICKSTSA